MAGDGRTEGARHDASSIVPLEPPRSFDSPLHSQGVLLPAPGRLVVVSGQVGVRPDATTGTGMAEQTRIAFENISRVLGEADLALTDLASLRIYLTAPEHIGVFTETAGACLGGHRPASTLLVVEHLANPALLVQIEALAVGGA